MSKISDAKKKQEYTTSAPKCANCAHLHSKKILPRWMVEQNEFNTKHDIPFRYSLESQGVEKDLLRCGIGGFAVKKMGFCIEYTQRRNTEEA